MLCRQIEELTHQIANIKAQIKLVYTAAFSSLHMSLLRSLELNFIIYYLATVCVGWRGDQRAYEFIWKVVLDKNQLAEIHTWILKHSACRPPQG